MVASKECRIRLVAPLPPDANIAAVMHDFYKAVNMSVDDLETFLASSESKQAAEQGDGEEHEGRHLARRVIELLRKKPEQDSTAGDYPGSLFYEGDFEHAYQICSYIKCHKEALKQHPVPRSELAGSVQRYQLMNVGFDPCADVELQQGDEGPRSEKKT